jgi:hypothetical protein
VRIGKNDKWQGKTLRQEIKKKNGRKEKNIRNYKKKLQSRQEIPLEIKRL